MPNTAKLTLVTVEGEGLHFIAATPRGHETLMDGGKDAVAASPVELLLESLAGCMAMDVISILRKKRQRVTGYVIEAHGDRREEHPRSFTRIELVHRITGHEVSREAAERSIELSHTRYCSVSASLDPAITIVNRVEIVAAGAPAGKSE